MAYDPVKELSDLLRSCNARATFDKERSWKLPCVICATTTEPRLLVKIGVYTRRMGGNLQPGDAIERPMCQRCHDLTTNETARVEPGGAP